MSCGVGHRLGLDPELLRLWHRPAAVAPIGPLAWELPYATSAALKRKKKERKENSVGLHQLLKVVFKGLISVETPKIYANFAKDAYNVVGKNNKYTQIPANNTEKYNYMPNCRM